MTGVTSIYAAYAGHSTPPDHGWRSDLPPRGADINVFKIGDGCS
jgi:hypothetical protein